MSAVIEMVPVVTRDGIREFIPATPEFVTPAVVIKPAPDQPKEETMGVGGAQWELWLIASAMASRERLGEPQVHSVAKQSAYAKVARYLMEDTR